MSRTRTFAQQVAAGGRVVVAACLVSASVLAGPPAPAETWRSSLYPESWTPPVATAFDAPMIQDFSYAGYHRGERAVPDVSGPVFDVLDHGADPTGEEDATGHIQAAIDAAANAGGGVVRLPAGTYRVRPPDDRREALLIFTSNVVLRGDGPGRTFIFNDEPVMRRKAVIRVTSDASGDWSTPTRPPTLVTADLLTPTTQIPVASVAGFAVGDWVVLRADATAAFIAEHGMLPEWEGATAALRGVMFHRQIIAIDAAARALVVDTPIRYSLKVRDAARVYPTVAHLEEVGLENFSIGGREHPGSGLAEGDVLVRGTAAYDVHGASLISVASTRNGWIRNVHSYRPAANEGNFHMVSSGIRIGHSRFVTVEGCDLARPQYRGAGGNGYMYLLHGQELLVKDSAARFSRHGFVFMDMQTSGNVLLRPLSQYSGFRSAGDGSDHHEYLSQSNLVDGATVDRDWFEARYRDAGATVEHGITAVHTVFWNTKGLAYHPEADYVVHSQQFGHGYVIGTRGAATGVMLGGDKSAKTDPVDRVEGVGRGDSLAPASLYEDQLARRLAARSPPPATAACGAPGRYVGTVTWRDGSTAVIRTRQRGRRGLAGVAGRLRCKGAACPSRRGRLSTHTERASPPATGWIEWRGPGGGARRCHVRFEETDAACRRCRGPISCATPPDFANAAATVELVHRRCRPRLLRPDG